MKKWSVLLTFLGIGLVVLVTWLFGLKLLVEGVIPIKIWQYAVHAVIVIVFLFNLDDPAPTCNQANNV